MDRRLKNLFSMYRWVGYQIFTNEKLRNGAVNLGHYKDAEAISDILDEDVRKYEMLKQILIER